MKEKTFLHASFLVTAPRIIYALTIHRQKLLHPLLIVNLLKEENCCKNISCLTDKVKAKDEEQSLAPINNFKF